MGNCLFKMPVLELSILLITNTMFNGIYYNFSADLKMLVTLSLPGDKMFTSLLSFDFLICKTVKLNSLILSITKVVMKLHMYVNVN